MISEVLVAEDVGEGDLGAAEEIAARGHAQVQGRTSFELHSLEPLLGPLVLGDHLVGHVGLEVDRALVGGTDFLLHLLHGVGRVPGVETVLGLVVGDEGHPIRVLSLEDGGRHVAAEGVGVLLDDPGLEVQAPEVRDVVVLVRREVEALAVGGEGRSQVVVGPEGELGLAARVREREREDLVVAGDAPGVDHGGAVRRDLGIVVGELVVRQVLDLPAREVQDEDVGDRVLQGGKDDLLAAGKDGRGPGPGRG